MNFGRFFSNELCKTYSRIFTRDFNKRTQKFDYKKVVKVNKQANRKPRLSLILREEVPSLGSVGQMVQVKRGYGRNYLIPNRLAVYATRENIEKYLVTSDEDTTKTIEADTKIVPFLESSCLKIVVKAGMDGWQVTNHRIALECRKRLNVVVTAHCVGILQPITSYGEHIVDIMVNRNVTTKLKCEVVPNNA